MNTVPSHRYALYLGVDDKVGASQLRFVTGNLVTSTNENGPVPIVFDVYTRIPLLRSPNRFRGCGFSMPATSFLFLHLQDLSRLYHSAQFLINPAANPTYSVFGIPDPNILGVLVASHGYC